MMLVGVGLLAIAGALAICAVALMLSEPASLVVLLVLAPVARTQQRGGWTP